MIPQVISHYRIVKKLGAGGMGEVYLAEDLKLNRKVAVKFLPPRLMADEQARRRLLREARAAATLDHPNICAIHEIGEEDGIIFIVMQYAEGETLSSCIQKGALDLGQCVEAAVQVADALSEAHSQKIVHRDVKPHNIIVNARGQVKVLDFGLAKITESDSTIEDGDTQSALTEAGVIMGTAAYMSPEQARGAKADERSDIFSLGATLYECATGSRPFRGATMMEVCAQVIHVNPPLPSQIDARVPAELDRIILKAIAKDASERYRTAEEMRDDLKAVRGLLENEAQARTRPAAQRASTSRVLAIRTIADIARRPRALVTALASIVVAVIAVWAVVKAWPVSPYQPSQRPKQFFDEGVSALRDGAYIKARNLFNLAIEADDRFALAYARRAEVLMELDYSDKAREELLHATSLVFDRVKLGNLDNLRLQAINSTLIRKLPDAIEKYKEILRLSSEEEKHQVYFDLGRSYERNYDIENAIAHYEEAFRREPRYAAALLRLGALFGRQKKIKEAEEKFQEAQRIYESVGNTEGATEAIFLLGYVFNSNNDLPKARKVLENARSRAQTHDNKAQQIRILLTLSDTSYLEGKTDEARQLAQTAIDMAKAESLENLAVTGIIAFGNTLFDAGNYEEAIKYFNQALDIARMNNGRKGESDALLSLGSLNIQQGKADEGAPLVELSLALYKEGDYRAEVSNCLMLLGRVQRQKGNYDEALKIFKEQINLAEELNDLTHLSLGSTAIGNLYSYQEKYADALEHFRKSRGIDESLGIKLYVGHDLMNEGRMRWALGDYKEAERLFNQALDTADQTESGYKQLQAWVQVYTARMRLSQLDYRKAIESSRKAIDLAGDQYKDIALMSRMALGLAMVLSKQSSGLAHCRESLAMSEKQGNPRLISETRLALAEALLETGHLQETLAVAQQAEKECARLEKLDSQWRASLIAARACESAGDRAGMREQAASAAGLLKLLEQRFGSEHYRAYLDRPDVKKHREQLQKIPGVNA